MNREEPTYIGRAAESRRLQGLADRTGAKVLTGTFAYAEDAALRDRPDEWFVQDASGAIVFHSEDADGVAAWLSALP